VSELVDDGVVDGPTVTVVMIGSTVFATPTPATRDTQQRVDSGRRYRRRSAGSPDPTAHNTLTGVTVPSQVPDPTAHNTLTGTQHTHWRDRAESSTRPHCTQHTHWRDRAESSARTRKSKHTIKSNHITKLNGANSQIKLKSNRHELQTNVQIIQHQS